MGKSKEYRALEGFVKSVEIFLVALDIEMKKPSDFERGRRVAQLSNALELAKDRIRFNELGIDFRTGKKRKPIKQVSVREKVRQVLHDRGFKGY